jgi:hypothetical protein
MVWACIFANFYSFADAVVSILALHMFYHIPKVSLVRHSNGKMYEISTADTTKFTHYDRDGLLCQEMNP